MVSTENGVVWPAHAAAAVEALDASIPAEWKAPASLLAEQYPPGSDVRPLATAHGLLTERELAITDPTSDVTGLLEALARGEYSAEETLTAFAKRAALAQQATRCLSDWFFAEALVRAKALDALRQGTGKLAGPLHGLPISIKSQFNYTGRPSSAGLSNFEVAKDTSALVMILESLGAIVFCKTNLPQAIMALECHSFWGHCVNPLNTALSPGGSSGGCSALMAFGGSCLSIGSDIGGSVRNPAASVGLWGLKCTTLRLPRGGIYKFNAGFDSIVGTPGFLCRSLRDVDLLHRLTLGAEPWLDDPSLLPLPWRRVNDTVWKGSNGRLRVGFMEHDGYIQPHPPILRGLGRLRAKLQQNPVFEVVSYDPYQHERGDNLASCLFYPDGGERLRQVAAATGEPVLPLMEWKLSTPQANKKRTIHELWDLNADREAYRSEYLRHWKEAGVDIVMCPAHTQTAARHGTSRYWGYTSVFNVVDYPAMAFPTGLSVDPSVDAASGGFVPLSKADQEVHELYDPQHYLNSPICLQAVAVKYADEKLVQVMELVSRVLPL